MTMKIAIRCKISHTKNAVFCGCEGDKILYVIKYKKIDCTNMVELCNKNVMLMNRINFTKYNLSPRSIGEVIEIIRRGNYNIHDNEFGDMNLKEATDLVRSHPNDMQKM